ncbi:MAG: T9SS type A sorting domain-containing protein [Bacteroidota bacterium]
MIKKILFSALMFSTLIISAQTFTATYSFAATTSVSGTTDPTPPPVVTGLTCGSFMAVGTPSSNPNAGNRFSFVGWPTGALSGTVSVDTYSTMSGSINTNEYYEVVLTPQSGYTLALNGIAFTVQRSSAGIRNYAVRTSVDGFTNNLPAAVVTNTNLSVVGTNEFFWNFDAFNTAQNGSNINLFGATSTSSVAFRFYGWNSETLAGTFSIDNVAFTGTVTGTPAPCISPTITSITNNSPVCANQVLDLQSAISGDAPFTYSWTGAGSFGSVNSMSTTVTGATSSDYTLSVSNACGTATAVTTASVNALPVLTISGSQILDCYNPTVTITLTTTPSSGLIYSWSGPIVSGQGTDAVIVNAADLYSVTVTNTLNGCSDTATSSVSSNTTSPTMTISGAQTLNCSTQTVVISIATTPSSGLTYTWSGTVVSGQGTDAIVVNTADVYSVTITDATNGCSTSATSEVSSDMAIPTVSLNTSSINLQCVTINSVTLVGGTPSGGVYIGNGVTSGVFSPSAVGIGTYTITYTYTDATNGCSNSASDYIVVDACTGINTLTNSNLFNLYPNPNSGYLTIQSSVFPADLNVFNINGKQVLSQKISALETVVDLSGLTNGIYQLNIKTEENSFNHKVLINK